MTPPTWLAVWAAVHADDELPPRIWVLSALLIMLAIHGALSLLRGRP